MEYFISHIIIPKSPTNILVYARQSYLYKFCGECGHYARADDLKRNHLPFCQPELEIPLEGFVRLNEEPRRNKEEFRMTLSRL